MTEAEYGLWPSPITAEIVSQGAKSFGTIEVKEGQIYWEEIRPLEGGRTVITSTSKDFTPPSYNARSMVHEYGGKSFTTHESTIYFVNKKDQRIYQQIGDLITPITKEGPRFADLCFTPQGLIAIGEVHHDEGLDVDNFLALIDLPSGTIDRLAEGEDFYSSPALHPNGKTLAWISWNLPYLPWDGCDLFVGELTDKSLTHIKKIAGSISESISQPKWGPDGLLYFISDKSGWWNIYRLKDHQIESLCPMEAEFGMPQWSFGISTYDFVDDEIICTYFQNGIASLAIINPNTKRMKKLPVMRPSTGKSEQKAMGSFTSRG